VDAYGANESIVSNCHVRIAFSPIQIVTADLLSKMTGTATVQKASYNFSVSRWSPVMNHINASVDYGVFGDAGRATRGGRLHLLRWS
jgi:type IV secretion system protein VirD4